MKDFLQTPIGKVMTRKVIAVHKDKPIKDVFQLMEKHAILGLPVVDDGNHVVGMVTESDLTKHFTTLRLPHSVHLLGSLVTVDDLEFNQHLREHCAETAGELMRSPVITIGLNDKLLHAINFMTEHKVNRLPVVNGNGELCGIVTRLNIIHELAKLKTV